MQLHVTHYRLNAGDEPIPHTSRTTIPRINVENGSGGSLLINGRMTRVYSILFEGGYEWRGYHWLTPPPAEPRPAAPAPADHIAGAGKKVAMTFEAALVASGKRYSFVTIGFVRAGWDLAQWARGK